MRFGVGHLGGSAVACALVVGFSACAAKTAKPNAGRLEPPAAREAYVPSQVPTVPPPASTAFPSARPTPDAQARKGKPGEPIGPVITFLGITRADGRGVEPESVDSQGVATYRNFVGSGFQLVVEAKPGLSGYDVARRLFAHAPNDPKLRPDLEIEVSHPLGDGSTAVCDRSRPKIGGIPAVNPPSFKESQEIADAMNDLACRFDVFIESDSACSLSAHEDWAFKSPDTQVQFCALVARAWNFPVGDTLVSVRVRDTAGNPGPIKRIRITRPKEVPTPRPRPTAAPSTPKALPTR